MSNFNVGDMPISFLFDDDISHTGILGMKWGVRRYQNEDGTLTEQGKLRYYGKSEYKKSAAYENEKIRLASDKIFETYKLAYEQSDAFKSDDENTRNEKYASLKKQAFNSASDQWISETEAEFKQAQDINKYAMLKINTGKDVLSSTSDILNKTSSLVPNVKGKETHPDYGSITTEELRKRTERLNAETNYARAAGQMIYTPSKEELTREKLQTIGAIAGILASVVGGIVIPLAKHHQGYAAPGADGGKKN